MKKKLLWGGAGLFVVLLVVGLLVFQPWLLFIDDKVDEDLPDDVAATDPSGLDAPGKASPGDDATATEGAPGEDVPEWTELASGEFIDAEHGTSGTARIVRAADGSRQVWLEGLDTSNGPDLHVWITDQPSGGDCDGCFDSWGDLRRRRPRRARSAQGQPGQPALRHPRRRRPLRHDVGGHLVRPVQRRVRDRQDRLTPSRPGGVPRAAQ